MNVATKIICRSIGVAGVGVALYDSSKVAKHFSKVGEKSAQARQITKAYSNSRTSDDVSHISSVIGEKTFLVRSNNPLPSFFGKIKGWMQGLIYGIGNHLPMVLCSTLALVGKNWTAKFGAIGACACAVYKILREGFGIGKHSAVK